MKQILCVFGMFFFSLMIAGCAFYSTMAVPANPVDKDKLEFITHVNNQATGLRFLSLGNVPSAMALANESVRKAKGDGIVNLEVTFSEGFFGPISIPRVTIAGDVVRLKSRETAAAAVWGPEASGVAPAIPAPVVEAVPSALPVGPTNSKVEKWKEDLLKQINTRYVKKGWDSYLQRTGKTITYEAWVSSLSEKDYNEYKKSIYGIQRWLTNKWKAEKAASQ